jgi:hypothetical protein
MKYQKYSNLGIVKLPGVLIRYVDMPTLPSNLVWEEKGIGFDSGGVR